MNNLRAVKNAFLVFFLLLPLASCSRTEAPNNVGKDYGLYIGSHGRMAYTSTACVYVKNERLMFIPNDLSAPAAPLCFDPTCTHSGDACSAYIGSPCIYSCDDELYFIEQTGEGRSRLCKMSSLGENRRAVRDLPMLFVNEGSAGYTADIRSGFLVLSLTTVKNAAPCPEYWMIDVRDPGSEPVRLFADDGSTYRFLNLIDGEAYFSQFVGGTESIQLVSYSIAEGTVRVLVENWARENCMHAQNGMLYWYAPDDGFFSMDLTTGESVKHRSADHYTEFGAAIYDDKYICFSNAIPVLDARKWVPDGKRGISVFDFEGNLLTFIPSPVSESPGGLNFEMVTEENALLHAVSGDNTLPKWYVNKSDIENGTAKLIPVSDSSHSQTLQTP